MGEMDLSLRASGRKEAGDGPTSRNAARPVWRRSGARSWAAARWTAAALRYNHFPMIPALRPDGYLPEGLHVGSEAEVTFRFGSTSRRRRRLVLRLRRWVDLGRKVGARRLLVDGSFVTAKEAPQDIDSIILLPSNFAEQVAH